MSRAHPPTRLLRCGVPDEAERGLAKAILLGVALISPGAVALLGRPQPVVPRSTCGAWCTRGRNGNRGLSLQIAAAFRSATSTGTIPNPALLAAKLTGTDGKSAISFEDFAVALVDELEQPRHSRRRFTVGY